MWASRPGIEESSNYLLEQIKHNPQCSATLRSMVDKAIARRAEVTALREMNEQQQEVEREQRRLLYKAGVSSGSVSD